MQVQKSGLFLNQNSSNQLTQKSQKNQNLKRQSQNDVKDKFNIVQNNTNKKQINQILNESHITFSHNPSPKNQIYSDEQSQFINQNLQIIAQEINQQTIYNNEINFNKQKNVNIQKANDNISQSSLNKNSTSHQFKLTFGENKFNQILDQCLTNNNVEEDLNQQNEFINLPQKKKQKNQENLINEKLQQENKQNQLSKQIISKNSNTNLKIKKSNQINTQKQKSPQAQKNYKYEQKLIQNVDVDQEIKQQQNQIQLQKNDVKDSENPDTPKFASQKADLNVSYKLGQSSLKKYFINKEVQNTQEDQKNKEQSSHYYSQSEQKNTSFTNNQQPKSYEKINYFQDTLNKQKPQYQQYTSESQSQNQSLFNQKQICDVKRKLIFSQDGVMSNKIQKLKPVKHCRAKSFIQNQNLENQLELRNNNYKAQNIQNIISPNQVQQIQKSFLKNYQNQQNQMILGDEELKQKELQNKDNAVKPEEDSQETLIQWQSKQTGVSESMEEATQRTINLSQQGQIKYENRYNKIVQNNNNLTHLSQQMQKSQKVKKTLKELKTNFKDEEQNNQNQSGYYNWNSYQNLGVGNIGISPTQKIKNRPSNLELMENILGGQKQNISIKHESLHNLESLYSPHSLQYMNNKYRMNQRSYSQQHDLDGEDFSPLFSPLAQKKVVKSTKNSIDITSNNGFNLNERINKLPNLGITRSEANSANHQMISSPQKKQYQNQRQRLRPITTYNIEQQYEQQQEKLQQLKYEQQVQEQKQCKINNDVSKNENNGKNDLKQRKVVRNIILQKQKDVPSVFYEPNSASVKRSQKRNLCLFKNQSSQQQQQEQFSSDFNLQECSQNYKAKDQRYLEQDNRYKVSNTTKHSQQNNNQKFQQFQDIINTQNKSKRSISNQLNLRSDVDSLEDLNKFSNQYFNKYHHSSQSKNRKNSFYQQKQELNNENVQSQQGYKQNQNNNILNLIRVSNFPDTKQVQSNNSKFNQENNKLFERTSLKPHLNIDTVFQKPRLQLEELNNQNISITNQKENNKKKELLLYKQN